VLFSDASALLKSPHVCLSYTIFIKLPIAAITNSAL